MKWGLGGQAFFIACFLFFGSTLLVASAESDAEHIEQFDVDITVDQSGKIYIAETIRYHFGSAERHGIYRDIPFEYTDSRGKRSIPVDVESVGDGEGNTLQFEESRSSGYVRVKIGDPNQLKTGTETYVIRYSVQKAISYFPEYDELYWNAIGNAWEVPILASTVTIRTAQPILGDRFTCYLGPVGSTERCAIADTATVAPRSEFRASADRALLPGMGMTVALGFPKGVVHERTGWERLLDFLGENPFTILPFVVFGFMLRRWWRDGRDPKGRGTVVPEYDIPGNLSPFHMAVLQDGRLTGKEIPAGIIDLAVRGHLVIERISEDGLIFDSTDYRLSETGKRPMAGSIEKALTDALFESDALSAIEVEKIRPVLQASWLPKIFRQAVEAKLPKELVSGESRSVKVSELKNKFYRRIPELEKRAVADLVGRKFFLKSPQEVWGSYTLWGIAILVAAFFVLPVLQLEGPNVIALLVCVPIYAVFAYLMPRVTREGAIMKERLLGLKDYLQIAEKRRIEFHNAPEKTPELFEKLLPVALLLGVSDIWAKEFADLTMVEPEWYRGGTASPFSAASFTTNLGGFSTATASSLTSAPSGSGSSGGGFSGGGGGGGGGGSW